MKIRIKKCGRGIEIAGDAAAGALFRLDCFPLLDPHGCLDDDPEDKSDEGRRSLHLLAQLKEPAHLHAFAVKVPYLCCLGLLDFSDLFHYSNPLAQQLYELQVNRIDFGSERNKGLGRIARLVFNFHVFAWVVGLKVRFCRSQQYHTFHILQ